MFWKLLASDVLRVQDNGHARKMRYCLTKADTLTSKSELAQVIQNVVKELGPLLKEDHSTVVKTIWLPDAVRGGRSGDRPEDYAENSIHEILSDIEERVKAKVQNNMDTVSKHTNLILDAIPKKRQEYQQRVKDRSKLMLYSLAMWPLLLFPLLVTYLELMSATGLLDDLQPLLPARVFNFCVSMSSSFSQVSKLSKGFLNTEGSGSFVSYDRLLQIFLSTLLFLVFALINEVRGCGSAISIMASWHHSMAFRRCSISAVAVSASAPRLT